MIVVVHTEGYAVIQVKHRRDIKLHSTAPCATLTPLSCSPNFPRAQYLGIRTLTHELIVNLLRAAVLQFLAYL